MSDLKKMLDSLKSMVSSKDDDDHKKRIQSIQDILNTIVPSVPVRNNNLPPISVNNGAGYYSGSSGFSGFSGVAGLKTYFTRQDIIDAYLACYKAMQLIDEEIKPEIIEMAKKYADSL